MFLKISQNSHLRPATLLKKRLRHRCFSVSFGNIVFVKHLRATVSVLRDRHQHQQMQSWNNQQTMKQRGRRGPLLVLFGKKRLYINPLRNILHKLCANAVSYICFMYTPVFELYSYGKRKPVQISRN